MNVNRKATVRDLVEEAKKRIVFLFICVVGLSYLMSLTSSSVLFNLPAAAVLIFTMRYFSLDFEMQRRKKACPNKESSENVESRKKPQEYRTIVKAFEWRRKVDSPVVEDAIEWFVRRIVSEWVTDLWYSRLTPDKEGPDDLVQMMNNVIGEVCYRAKSINIIHLVTRDIVDLICAHLELLRATQAKIETQHFEMLAIGQRDAELKLILAEEDKLHPALFSIEAEYKVLQHLMDRLISLIFKPEDLQCSFFRCTARELLACAVMRPVLNLFTPRFINERIEIFALSNRSNNRPVKVPEVFRPNKGAPPKISSNHFSPIADPSITEVELVQLKNYQSGVRANELPENRKDVTRSSKDPLLSVDLQSTHSWTSLLSSSPKPENINITKQCHSSGEWGDVLDMAISKRETGTLTQEKSETKRAKGRNSRKDRLIKRETESRSHLSSDMIKKQSWTSKTERLPSFRISFRNNIPSRKNCNLANNSLKILNLDVDGPSWSDLPSSVDGESRSSDSLSDNEIGSDITGQDSNGIKVWGDRKNINGSVAHIRHPLESLDYHKTEETNDKMYEGRPRRSNIRKRSRNSQQAPIWQEVERTSFLSGDGQDILHSLKEPTVCTDSSDDSELEGWGRVHSGISASSSTPISFHEHHGSPNTPKQHSFLSDSFLKLRCEVLGAHIVKSGSKTFAVYAISVTDVDDNTWSIKRRFRHFEELHRRLKVLRNYNHPLPPKHFLSTSLDVPIILERCKLLDRYLKSLMKLSNVSSSIEVWDFLSIDSQTYTFSNSLSIVETLSVNLVVKPSANPKRIPNSLTHVVSSPCGKPSGSGLSASSTRNHESEKKLRSSHTDSIRNEENMRAGITVSSLETMHVACPPSPPVEWVPPNLSAPILDLVDVIFQFRDGGWIRRQVFWVAKQVLQLGMGDAFDDWLVEKLQLFRKGSVIASGIKRLEQILWPDGIFITKHPSRQNGSSLEEQQRQEADRRAKFVYELMIEKAPAAIVGLVGRKEYEQCAKDVYFFLQSSLCLKQFAYGVLELLLLSAFPELNDVFQNIHNNRQQFGKLKTDPPRSISPKS